VSMSNENARYSIFEEEIKVLRVEEQKNITTYLNFSLPLCSVLWDKKKSPWFLEHFTNIYTIRQDNEYLWLDYLEKVHFIDDIMECISVSLESMKTITDIVSYIKEKINAGFYLILFVNSYYIKASASYQNYHNPLQLYIYGYDDRKALFYGIGFNTSSNFDKIVYTYEEVEQGFLSCINNNTEIFQKVWIKWYCCSLMKVKDVGEEYLCKPHLFINDIENYIESKDLINKLRPEIVKERGNVAKYGISAFQEVINTLYELNEGKFNMDYRYVHLIAERSKLMHEKIVYISEHFNMENELKSLIDQYLEISRELKKTRFIFIKGTLLQNEEVNIYAQLKDKKIIDMIISIYEKVIVMERKVLTEVCNIMKYNIPKHEHLMK